MNQQVRRLHLSDYLLYYISIVVYTPALIIGLITWCDPRLLYFPLVKSLSDCQGNSNPQTASSSQQAIVEGMADPEETVDRHPIDWCPCHGDIACGLLFLCRSYHVLVAANVQPQDFLLVTFKLVAMIMLLWYTGGLVYTFIRLTLWVKDLSAGTCHHSHSHALF